MAKKPTPYPYPEPARTEILELHRQIIFLNDLDLILRHLYTPDAYKLYMQVSFLSLQVIPWIIHDTIVSGIGKLTDPAGKGDRKNINLETLKETVIAQDPAYKALADRIEKFLSRKEIQSLRRHRHKRIAHSDYDVHLGKGKLPRYKNTTVEKVLRDITKLMDSISNQVLGGEIMYSNERQIREEAKRFLSALDKGLKPKKIKRKT
jgi:hypothetical protein